MIDGELVFGYEDVIGAEAGVDFAHLLKAAEECSGEVEQHERDGDLRDDEGGAQPGMTGGSGSGAGSLFEALNHVGAQGGEGGRETAEGAGDEREKNGEGSHGRVDGDGVDARHGFGQGVQSEANGGGGKGKAEEASGEREQQGLRRALDEG